MDSKVSSRQGPFAAVIFDCDGVLVDSEVVGLQESADYLNGFGLDWTKAELIERFSGLRDDQFFDMLSEAFKRVNGAVPDESFFAGLYDQRLLSDTPIVAIEGAHETLKGLDVEMAVASSSRADRLANKLKTNDLWGYFDPHIYSADVVARGKPDPAIYQYTAQQLGADPAQCLVIEDSANGVRSAVNAGMTVWGFVGGGHCFEGHETRLLNAGAQWVAPNYTALSKQLDAHCVR